MQLVHKPKLLLILACLLCSFSGIASRDFSTRGEGREALVAQAMEVSGNYILPTGYGGDVPSKPPFLHWMINACAFFTGDVSEFSARLPNALASAIFLVCFFTFLLRQGYPERCALFACFMLLTSFEWLRHSSNCRVDMLLATTLAGAWLVLFRWWERELRGVPWPALILLAAATLAKGPVALVLTAGIFGIFFLVRGLTPTRIARVLALVLLPPALAAGSWYLAAYIVGGEAFWQKVFYENVQRFNSSMDDEPHRHGLAYHPLMLLIGFLPWTLFFLPSLLGALKQKFSAWRSLPQAFHALPPLRQFCLCAGLLTLCFFSIPASKRAVYLLPAYPFYVLLLVDLLPTLRESLLRALWKIELVLYALVWLLLLSAPLWLASVHPALAPYASPMLRSAGLFLPLAALALYLFRKPAERAAVLCCCLIALAQSAVLGSAANAISYRPFSQQIGQTLQHHSADPLYSFDNEFYGISFYTRRRIDRLPDELPDRPFLVIYKARNEAALKEKLKGRSMKPLQTSPLGVTDWNLKVQLSEVS